MKPLTNNFKDFKKEDMVLAKDVYHNSYQGSYIGKIIDIYKHNHSLFFEIKVIAIETNFFIENESFISFIVMSADPTDLHSYSIIDKNDIILYTHFEYKSRQFFDILNEITKS